MSSSAIYLDNAATTPMLPQVVEAMLPYLKEKFGNPSSIYTLGREAKIAIEKVRQLIAEELNCNKGEIIFTSGGTEGINKIIGAAIQDLKCTRIITSTIEHHATLHTIEYYAKHHAIKVDFINIKENGHLDYIHLENLLTQNNQKTFVIVLHANNEIGNINNAIHISELCKKHHAYIALDTVQTIAHYKIDLQKIKVDFLTCAAHKFHGPKGVGFIYVSHHHKITPLLHGGAQERSLRAGTENVAAIVGMGVAFEHQYLCLEAHKTYISELKNYFFQQLKNEFVGIKLFGDANFNHTLYTVLNIGFPKNEKTEMLLLQMDIQGVYASGGSACSSGAATISHVIKALSLEYEKKYQPIRFSFSHLNTRNELDHSLRILKKILHP